MVRRRIFLVIAAVLVTSFVSGQEIRKIKITDLEKIIAESKTPLIVNFWATWCVPCVEEIPWFQEEVRKHNRSAISPKDSLQLIFVSLDFREAFPDGLAKFARKRNIYFPVCWLDESNADYFCPKVDPKWSGAIPASLFVNTQTGYRKFFEEQLSKEKLEKEIMAILQKP